MISLPVLEDVRVAGMTRSEITDELDEIEPWLERIEWDRSGSFWEASTVRDAGGRPR